MFSLDGFFGSRVKWFDLITFAFAELIFYLFILNRASRVVSLELI
jgi:hypothetical protein